MSYVLLNYTPHSIHLHAGPGVQTVESLGEARAAEISTLESEIPTDPFGDGGMCVHVPIAHKRYGDVTGLPAPRPDHLYIVSTLIQQACPERADLVSPDGVIRDASGRVTGCTGFYRLAK
jgi:hypothetical protein